MNSTKIIELTRISIKTSFQEIYSHKFRSSLTLIGVMLGVAAIVAMSCILKGTQGFIKKIFDETGGLSRIMIEEIQPSLPEEQAHFSRSPGLRLNDTQFLEKHGATVRTGLVMKQEWTRIALGSSYFNCRLSGVNQSYLEEDLKHNIKIGERFNSEHYEQGDPVCLVGKEIYTYLNQYWKKQRAQEAGILNQWIHLENGLSLKIIGMIDTDFSRWRIDRTIFIPIKTLLRYQGRLNPSTQMVSLLIKDPLKIEEAQSEITSNLLWLHRGAADFTFRTSDWIKNFTSMFKSFNYLFGAIASIGLFVGGLSIMNIMLSSIAERIREIGIKKALGATRTQIFFQFIVESMTLSMVGGTLGLILGLLPLLFAEPIKKGMEITIGVHYGAMLVAWLFSIFVGFIFGLYPAWKAARLSPIQALHYQ